MGKIIFPTEMAQCHLYMNDNLRSVNNTVFITFILYIQATLNKVLLGTIFVCSCTKNLFFFFFLINCIQYIWFLLLFGSYQEKHFEPHFLSSPTKIEQRKANRILVTVLSHMFYNIMHASVSQSKGMWYVSFHLTRVHSRWKFYFVKFSNI